MLRSFSDLVLPDDVLLFEGERFLALVRRTCGDALAFLREDYRELEKIKERACLHLDDGSVLIKPGLRIDFDRFLNTLRVTEAKHQQKTPIDQPIDQILSSIETLIKSYPLTANTDSLRSHSFLLEIVKNILENLMRQKNNYRYSEPVQRFAQALYVSGGRNTYEFVRFNLPSALPTLSTVDSSLKRSGGRITEGKFRYGDLKDHQRSYQYQLAVCSENCTAAVKKVTYNAANDTFSGFWAPLSSGIAVTRYFRTDSFEQLKEWFKSEDRSSYVNVHMLQPLTSSSSYVSPFLRAAYGTSNTFIAIDIFNRWKWMFENSRQANVRIVAVATDCDPRYLHAMRFALGFFAETDTSSLYDPNDVLQIELPRDWSRWFFMRTSPTVFLHARSSTSVY